MNDDDVCLCLEQSVLISVCCVVHKGKKWSALKGVCLEHSDVTITNRGSLKIENLIV